MTSYNPPLEDYGLVRDLLQGWTVPANLPLDAVTVPGRAEADFEASAFDGGLLRKAMSVRRQFKDATLAIPGHDGSYQDGELMEHGYPGFEAWKAELIGLGAPPDQICEFIVREEKIKETHTREECEGLVLLAKKRGWQWIVILAYPHQMVRVMGCLYKAMETMKYQFSAIPITPRHVDWMRLVYGSVGAEQLARWKHSPRETNKYISYVEKGYASNLKEMWHKLLATTVQLQNETTS